MLEKGTIGVLAEGFIDPATIVLDFDKFRTGPRTTLTVSVTGSRLVLAPHLLLVQRAPDWP